MKILQFFYENFKDFKPSFERKKHLEFQNTLIKGPRFCGKRALLYHFLSGFEEGSALFLDFEDLRFGPSSLGHLKEFLAQNPRIQIVVFYGIDPDFIFDFSAFKEIVFFVSSEFKSVFLKDFSTLELDFLDYEEFMSVSKGSNLSALLGLYLQQGRTFKPLRSADLKAYFSTLELEILQLIALHLGEELSINEIYKELKKSLKVSKDSLYKSVQSLVQRQILHFIKHAQKDVRKIYFRNFGLKNLLCIKKDFKHSFENLVLSELFKFQKEYFYDKFFDFYARDENKAYICAPLLDLDLIKIKAKKILSKALEMKLSHIIFITLSNEQRFYEQGVEFEVLSFEQFALSF